MSYSKKNMNTDKYMLASQKKSLHNLPEEQDLKISQLKKMLLMS